MNSKTVRAVALIGVVASIGYVTARQLRSPRLTPELRGYALAIELGCFACHGPGGTGGIPNPGSDEGEVPAWDGGNAMMYVQSEQEIREWILYGEPRRLSQGHDHHASSDSRGSALLKMPAYGQVLNEKELQDIVAYYKAVAVFDRMPDDAREGYRVARDNGCFGCHGVGGLVGTSNPRSFKGYIPPWRGADYRELVKTTEELRSWVLDGSIPRFDKNPAARFFTGRQLIAMPAYRDVLAQDEVDAVVRYISCLQQNP